MAKAKSITPSLIKESGQRDLNPRPTGPKPAALAKLRYAPIVRTSNYKKFDQ